MKQRNMDAIKENLSIIYIGWVYAYHSKSKRSNIASASIFYISNITLLLLLFIYERWILFVKDENKPSVLLFLPTAPHAPAFSSTFLLLLLHPSLTYLALLIST